MVTVASLITIAIAAAIATTIASAASIAIISPPLKRTLRAAGSGTATGYSRGGTLYGKTVTNATFWRLSYDS